MMQNPNHIVSELALVGEEISLELGRQMVKDYQDSNPQDVKFYIVGRQIIENILSQPFCTAIKFMNAYNEYGQKTLVYLGLDVDGQEIISITVVNEDGVLSAEKGIVADRIRVGGGGGGVKTTELTQDDWGWSVD